MDEMLKLDDFENYEGFTPAEKTAIAFAVEITVNPSRYSIEEEPSAVSQETRERLNKDFSEKQIVELVMGVTVFNFMNRFNRFMNLPFDRDPAPQSLETLFGK